MQRAQFLTTAAVAILVVLAALVDPAVAADRRVALVIGNSAYRNPSLLLTNPKNDAADVAAALRDLDFEVIHATDAKKDDFDRVLANFERVATGADVALFYYAGHALQFQGRNYLMPIDAELEDDVSLRYQMKSIDDVRAALDRVAGIKVMILDACRDNPIADILRRKAAGVGRGANLSRGLARVDPGQGIVAFATAADEVAMDGSGRNSPYTTALLRRLKEPGLEIEIMFRRVAADVTRQTNGKQRPETYVSLITEYYLNQKDQIAWEKIKSSEDPARFREYIKLFPSSIRSLEAQSRLSDLERAAREKQLNVELVQREAERVREQEEQGSRVLERERAERQAAQRRADERAKSDSTRRPMEQSNTSSGEVPIGREPQRAAAATEPPQRQDIDRSKVSSIRQQTAALPPEPGNSVCKREEAGLAALRASQRPDDIIRFERELTCERLRPQVVRLRESVVPPNYNAVATAPLAEGSGRSTGDTVAQGKSEQNHADAVNKREQQQRAKQAGNQAAKASESTQHSSVFELADFCKHDEERLIALRAAQNADDIARFERELTCERLRAQVIRLRESAAHPRQDTAAPAIAALEPNPSHMKAPQSVQSGTRTLGAPNEGTCRSEGEKLTHLRVSRSLDEIIRLQNGMKCEKLRLQVLRLRESVEAR